MRKIFKIFLALILAVCLSVSQPAYSCPFCSAPQLTISEQIAETDVAVIAEWVSGVRPDFEAGTPGTTTYRVETLIKQSDEAALKKDDQITVDEFYPGNPGEFALLAGRFDQIVQRDKQGDRRFQVADATKSSAFPDTPVSSISLESSIGSAVEQAGYIHFTSVINARKVNWLSPLDISKEGFEYVAKAPTPEDKPADRLKFFVQYLESNDPLVADDAYAEFANAPYETIVSVKESFPLEKIRKWVFSDETPVTRLGLYGLMLGLCGEEADRESLKAKVIKNDVDYRLGIDGVMAGYLLLSKEEGLQVLEEHKLKPSLEQPSEVPFSEFFAALQSLKFMWEYAPEAIPAERLRESMRMLIAHPDVADVVIIDLARWEDWSLLPRLKKMYESEEFDIPAVKRAIVGYLIASIKQKPTDPDAEVPAFVEDAEEFLAHLEETDPKTVRTARLLFR